MTLLADRGAEADTSTSAPASRSAGSRWRPVLAVVALVAAYAALPLFVRLDESVPVLPAGAGLEVEQFGATGSVFLHYEHGGTVTVEVPLHNPTPLPLTVDDVAVPDRSRPLLDLTDVGGTAAVPPFGTRSVELTFRYGNCRYYHERSAQTVDRLTITGSTLGRDFSTVVTLSEPLVVHGQVILDCPDRTLVRGDDRR